MMKQITPCLWFDPEKSGAKEAAELYCSVFENSKITAQSSMVTEIEVSGYRFVLLDGGPMYQPNSSISFFYICENEQELDRIWNAFSKEGTILMPLDN